MRIYVKLSSVLESQAEWCGEQWCGIWGVGDVWYQLSQKLMTCKEEIRRSVRIREKIPVTVSCVFKVPIMRPTLLATPTPSVTNRLRNIIRQRIRKLRQHNAWDLCAQYICVECVRMYMYAFYSKHVYVYSYRNTNPRWQDDEDELKSRDLRRNCRYIMYNNVAADIRNFQFRFLHAPGLSLSRCYCCEMSEYTTLSRTHKLCTHLIISLDSRLYAILCTPSDSFIVICILIFLSALLQNKYLFVYVFVYLWLLNTLYCSLYF